MIETDFLVIGSGIAGLTFSLKVSKYGKVLLITKKEKAESNTNYAQGGIAAVISPNDSFESHIEDTMKAGDGLCKLSVVEEIVKNAPERIKELIEIGVQFSKSENGKSYDLGKEGGHSHRRVLHATDLTGREIERALLNAVSINENITIHENFIAIDLASDNGKCIGCYALNKDDKEVIEVSSKVTILATGGIGKVYLFTSNPDIASGDGVAMAYRIGASIANMEFVQFHPTCLYHPYAKSFLISEALRGEKAILIDKNGNRFMEKYHELKELAPRDIVARAIDNELKKSGADCVYLDISFRKPDFIKKRFPNIYKTCLSFGIDMTKQPIPVVPAAHYACGGVKTNTSGETDIKYLFAIGEVACTGLHGANRLASNSLLEALVCAHNAAKKCKTLIKNKTNNSKIKPWKPHSIVDSDEMVVVSFNWEEVRRLMWNYVGIVRTNKRLFRAKRRIKNLQEEIDQFYRDFKINSDLIELRNIADVAEIIISSALMRKESRGLNYNLDYPNKLENPVDTIIKKKNIKNKV
ncbi:MAG: L-aspartate oxidase [Candidatus Helarchaeota archaeon]